MKIEIKKLNEVDQTLESAFATTLYDDRGTAIKTLITKKSKDTVESTWNLLYLVMQTKDNDYIAHKIDQLLKELNVELK